MTEPVLMLMITGFFGSFLCLLEKAYRLHKAWFLWILMFPPISLIFTIKFWREVQAPIIYMLLFFISNSTFGMIAGKPFTGSMLEAMYMIFLWPIFLIEIAWTYLST